MFNLKKYRRIMVRREAISVSSAITADLRRALVSPIPLLQQPRKLTDDAIEWFLHLHPPVVCQHHLQYEALGNLRSLELAMHLAPRHKVPVIILTDVYRQDIPRIAALLALLNAAVLGLDEKSAPGTCQLFWNLLDKQDRNLLSSEFGTKSRFAHLLGLNRRALSEKAPLVASTFKAG